MQAIKQFIYDITPTELFTAVTQVRSVFGEISRVFFFVGLGTKTRMRSISLEKRTRPTFPTTVRTEQANTVKYFLLYHVLRSHRETRTLAIHLNFSSLSNCLLNMKGKKRFLLSTICFLSSLCNVLTNQFTKPDS